MSDEGSGLLLLVGTPLGNRGDLSPRAREALLGADLLLCEDTRSPTRLLGNEVKLPPRLSCFVGNEHARVPRMLDALGRGERVAFVSEAGLPVWSDPGQSLVRAAVDAGFEVDVIPGPTAATVALVASGFDAMGAAFLGFLPRAGAERKARIAEIAVATSPIIIYEAGNRAAGTLADLNGSVEPEAAKKRQVVVARELTKAHQEYLRGSLAELAERVVGPLAGEVTLVIDGGPPISPQADPAREAAKRVFELMLDPQLRPRPRAKALAEILGLDASEIYDRLNVRD